MPLMTGDATSFGCLRLALTYRHFSGASYIFALIDFTHNTFIGWSKTCYNTDLFIAHACFCADDAAVRTKIRHAIDLIC